MWPHVVAHLAVSLDGGFDHLHLKLANTEVFHPGILWLRYCTA